ncbi:MAG: fibronectin type III domain-containing protein [Microgenomates group bacterium]|nr:fibronectin type III domain-containing protein [Microgenomates group bacterium]
MSNSKVTKITAILIGTVISLFLIMGGFKLIEKVFTRAADVEPRDVVVSELTQSSAKISWATGQDTQGVVEYGTSPTSMNFFGPESQMGKSHSVDLTLLSPGTTYYFQIRIGEKKYDNGGVPWTFTTKTREESLPTQISSPTPTVSQSAGGITPTPTPISSIKIDTGGCGETDCVKICQKINKGCTLNDFVKNKCIGKVNINNCQ